MDPACAGVLASTGSGGLTRQNDTEVRDDRPGRTDRADRADRVAARLSGPVLIAALASIPATFLTLFTGAYELAGNVLHVLSGAVLVAETVVLLVLAEDKREWLRGNRWLVMLTIAIVPAVVLAVGPVQLLRLLRVFGALRIVRVRRIFQAGRILRDRHGATGRWGRALTSLLTLAAAAFVALVLADPTSETRQLLERATERFGTTTVVVAVLVAGALVGLATYVVRASARTGATATPPVTARQVCSHRTDAPPDGGASSIDAEARG